MAKKEPSKLTKGIYRTLLHWRKADGKPSAYNLALKVGCSESSASKILRTLASEKAAVSRGGAWQLT